MPKLRVTKIKGFTVVWLCSIPQKETAHTISLCISTSRECCSFCNFQPVKYTVLSTGVVAIRLQNCTLHTHTHTHWDPYAMHGGGCLELYYCNMVEWSWCDSSLICKTNWFSSVLWHCWFGRMTYENRPRYDLCVWWDVKPCSISISLTHTCTTSSVLNWIKIQKSNRRCFPRRRTAHCCWVPYLFHFTVSARTFHCWPVS